MRPCPMPADGCRPCASSAKLQGRAAAVKRPQLSLDFVAPVTVGVGGDQFGTFVGGGTAAFWSDMLGRRNVVTALQVSGTFQDLTALVGYQNLATCWNRGVLAGQTSVLSVGFRRVVNEQEQSAIDSLYLFRQVNRQAIGLLAYPSSQVTRIEFTAGYRTAAFDREVRTREITTKPRLVVVHDPVDLPAPEPIHLADASAAVVHDNALFGATAPVLGQRYRFKAAPTWGSIRYYSVLLDYRRYVMPLRPYTLAGRVVHFGRYGPDADDERLLPLFIGFETLVRGYSAGSFDLRKCPAIIQQPDDCPVPVFERLLGSRILVTNFELRFPLARGLGRDGGPAGLPPVEGAVFLDAGVAWTSAEEPTVLGGTCRPVSSYGASVRTNLFGVAILDLGMVHPNDRSDRGWHLFFNIAPGF